MKKQQKRRLGWIIERGILAADRGSDESWRPPLRGEKGGSYRKEKGNKKYGKKI